MAFSLSQVWEREAASPSWLHARDGASLAVLSISCSVQVQTCWKKRKKRISAALSSPGSCPDNVVLSKPPLFASRAALEKAEPGSLAALGWRWSWWSCGPELVFLLFFWSIQCFLFIAGGICSPKAGRRLLCHPTPGSGCSAGFIQLEPCRVGRDQRKPWMLLRHGPASWRGEEENKKGVREKKISCWLWQELTLLCQGDHEDAQGFLLLWVVQQLKKCF